MYGIAFTDETSSFKLLTFVIIKAFEGDLASLLRDASFPRHRKGCVCQSGDAKNCSKRLMTLAERLKKINPATQGYCRTSVHLEEYLRVFFSLFVALFPSFLGR